MNATTASPEVTILDGVSYAKGVSAALVGGQGYWIADEGRQVRVSREDGKGRYLVDLGLKNRPVSCSCPDRDFRSAKPMCKHMVMVAAVMKGW